MRHLAAVIVLGFLAACEPVAQPNTTTDSVLPPPSALASSSTTSTTTAPPNTRNDPSPHSYRGVLPDGTDFYARVRATEREAFNSVQGTFAYMTSDGPVPVGGVRYVQTSDEQRTGYEDGILGLWLDPWYVEVIFSDEVLSRLGDESGEIAARSISLDIQGQQPFPILHLSPPFTWEGGDARIWWETFVIASGCGEVATVCTENRVVQLLSVSDIIEGEKGLTLQQIDGSTITTSSTRRPHDAHYLDPGPLDPRRSADLIWTGEEMIVWGGKQSPEGLPSLVDGAAFNPSTNEWRMLATFPLQGPAATRAVWADGEMIVVAPGGTFGYDSATDSWRIIADGVLPSEWHDRMLYADGTIYVWASPGLVNVLDLAKGGWRPLEVPESLNPHPAFGVLRYADNGVVAIVLEGNQCSGKSYYQLAGDDWVPWPDAELAAAQIADCSLANQSVSLDGALVVWDQEGHSSAMLDSSVGAWWEIDPIPMGAINAASGPVEMDADHFLVPRWDEAAIFDASSESWTRVELPGVASDAGMIWTGAEFLAWGVGEPFDAWRWTPGQTIIGGDDAT